MKPVTMAEDAALRQLKDTQGWWIRQFWGWVGTAFVWFAVSILKYGGIIAPKPLGE